MANAFILIDEKLTVERNIFSPKVFKALSNKKRSFFKSIT